MAAPRERMRLTVEVLPLAPENAHGPYQAAALEAFKGRKFALPVLLEDSFEKVWAEVEKRYKRNYLSALQSQAFTIQKLQDAYDCDLDLGDTVSSIFEGETDPQRRLIKVIPAFTNRDFSVPPTSHLRPGNVHKRRRRESDENANTRKKPRTHDLKSTRDQPLPSTESEHSGEDEATNPNVGTRDSPDGQARSASGGSVVFTHDAQTGHEEFGSPVKEESPELGLPLPPTIADQDGFSSQRLAGEANGQPRMETAATQIQAQDDIESVFAEDSQEVAIQQSPQSSPEIPETANPHRPTGRKDIYDTISSPEFTDPPSKRTKTYGRLPRTPRLVQSTIALLHDTEQQSAGSVRSQTSLSGKSRAFQRPDHDEIVSTPQDSVSASARRRVQKEGIQRLDQDDIEMEGIANNSLTGISTPENTTSPNVTRKSSLKKPSRLSYTMPTSNGKTHPFKTPNKSSKFSRERTGSSSKSAASKSATPVPGSTRSTKSIKDLKAQLEALKRRATADRSSQASSLSQVSIVRASPKVVISMNKAQQTPAPTPPVVQVLNSSQPGIDVPDKESHGEDTVSLESSKEPNLDNEASATIAQSRPQDASRNASGSSASNRTPLRSEVPLPANVRHNVLTSTVSSPDVNGEKEVHSVFKKPALKPQSSNSKASPSDSKTARQTPKSDIPKTSPIRSEVPLPANVRSQSTTSSAPRSTPIRSEVPLPSNVRHLASTATPMTVKSTVPEPKKASPSVANHGGKKEEPVVLSSGASSSSTDYSDSDEIEDGLAVTDEEQSTIEPSKQSASRAETAETNHDQPAVTTASTTSDNPETLPDAVADDAPTSGDQQSGSNEDRLEEANVSKASQNRTVPPTAPNDSQTSKGDDASTTKAWNATSWGFESLDQQNGTTDQLDETKTSRSHPSSRSGSPSENAAESEPEAQDESKSRSVSGINSTRSSPVVSRAARFLSHSPTPEKDDSEDESDDSPTPLREPSPKAADDKKGSDSDSSSSDSESSSDDSEDEDVEMANADAVVPSSSPPTLPQMQPTQVPSTSQASQPTRIPSSQSLPRVSQVPPPSSARVTTPRSNTPLRSSQAQLTRTRPTYQKFPSIRQQLTAARTPQTSSQANKKFDPKMQSLGKLAKAKLQAKKGILLDANDSSDSDDDSSSSSSEDGEAGKANDGGFCSVL